MSSPKPFNEPPPPAPPPSSKPIPTHPTFLPFHRTPGVSNFRDIGGWPISSPSSPSKSFHVRKGLLYRGSDTNRITPEGIAALRSLNITTDYDLRSKQQIEKTGGFKELGEWGIQREWRPVFGEEEYTEERARERYEMYAGEGTDGIVTAFIEILISGAPMFAAALTHILNTNSPLSSSSSSSAPPSSTTPPSQQPQALYLHCTTGNNRTGAFISLLLLLLRVPHPSIIAEYTLSEHGLAPTRHINVERLLKKGAFEGLAEEERRRKCERMVGARRESMRALLKEVERKWGVDGEGYFLEVVGLTEEQLGGLREVFTVEGEATGAPGVDGDEGSSL